tara:strand:- start:910 stop:1191 length:282 start_codon:yes stop_codon:yes gene_type:complete
LTDDDRLQWARDAKANKLLWESFDQLKEIYITQSLKCGEKDDLARFRYLKAYEDVEVVKRHLVSVFEQGRLAKGEETELKKTNKRFLPELSWS